MVAVTFLVVISAGALSVAAGDDATALGPATFIQGLMTTTTAAATGGMTMSTVVASAAIEAAAVGAVSGLSGAGLTDGVTAPYMGARSGFEEVTVPTGEAQKSLFDGTIAKFDTPSITGSGVLAVVKGSTARIAHQAPPRPSARTLESSHARTLAPKQIASNTGTTTAGLCRCQAPTLSIDAVKHKAPVFERTQALLI